MGAVGAVGRRAATLLGRKSFSNASKSVRTRFVTRPTLAAFRTIINRICGPQRGRRGGHSTTFNNIILKVVGRVVQETGEDVQRRGMQVLP